MKLPIQNPNHKSVCEKCSGRPLQNSHLFTRAKGAQGLGLRGQEKVGLGRMPLIGFCAFTC